MGGEWPTESVPLPRKLTSKNSLIHSTCLSNGQTKVFNQLMKTCRAKEGKP